MQNLVALQKKYGIPMEAVVKSDLLRLGISFSPSALREAARFKEKSYFIFSFDRVSQAELNEAQRHAAPEEIALTGGPYGLKRTIVSVRLNPESPYRISTKFQTPSSKLQINSKIQIPNENGFILFYNDEKICDVLLPERPAYYEKKLSNGKPVSDIAPTIEWGYLIYLTAFRLCQYWGAKEECQFCDINENYRQQKKERSYTAVKSPEEIVEALGIIDAAEGVPASRAYTVTGGAITSQLNGLAEAPFYARYAEAIEEKFPGRWIGKAVVQALPQAEVKILKEAGYRVYHPNFEVWDKNLFRKLCPGKEAAIGRDEWIGRILDAAEIFGAGCVIPNFVAGVELARPHGFETVAEAIASTGEGLEFFMSQGILPRFTVWCVEPNTALSRTNSEPPPLEYFVHLLQVYRETFHRHKLKPPPGYGPAGIGRAVFSVSAFMDVL